MLYAQRETALELRFQFLLSMRTLSSELGAHADQLVGRPRVYIDANIPSGAVAFMRRRLDWDALFVVEHDDLRRARDGEPKRHAAALPVAASAPSCRP